MSKKLWLTILICLFVGIAIFAFYNLIPTQTDLTSDYDQIRQEIFKITEKGDLTDADISRIQTLTSLLTQEHHSPPSVVIEPGSGVEAASYIIFKDDEGIVYAKNGNTGEIEFQSTNASHVIQSAMDTVESAGGGKVFIKKANYTLQGGLQIGSNTYLQLEKGSIVTQVDTGDTSTMFTLLTNKANANNFVVEGGIWDANQLAYGFEGGANWGNKHCMRFDSTASNYIIKDLTVKNAGVFGIINDGSTHYLIENVVAIDNGSNGIVVEGDPDTPEAIPVYARVVNSEASGSADVGINVFWASNVWFERLKVHDNNDPTRGTSNSRWNFAFESGVNSFLIDSHIYGTGSRSFVSDGNTKNIFVIGGVIEGASAEPKSPDVTFIGTIFNNIPIQFWGPATRITWIGSRFYQSTPDIRFEHATFIGNTFEHDTSGNGITIRDNAKYVLIQGNTFINTRISQNAGQSSDNIWIFDNDFTNTTNPINLQGTVTNLKVRRNLGYITEDNGNTTITAGQTSITVNLPSNWCCSDYKVILSPTTDTAGKRYWVSSKTSTQFAITIDSTHTSDISFDWYAEV